MKGIHAAFEGRLGADAEQRWTSDGVPMLSFSLVVEEAKKDGDSQWGENRDLWRQSDRRPCRAIDRGRDVYVKGYLRHTTWTSTTDGSQRCGLSLSAWEVAPMGINERRTRKESEARAAQARRPAPSSPAIPVPLVRPDYHPEEHT